MLYYSVTKTASLQKNYRNCIRKHQARKVSVLLLVVCSCGTNSSCGDSGGCLSNYDSSGTDIEDRTNKIIESFMNYLGSVGLLK